MANVSGLNLNKRKKKHNNGQLFLLVVLHLFLIELEILQ